MVSQSEQRRRIKGRKESGSFIGIPHQCLEHPNFFILNSYSVKLLMDICAQYKGKNNGDLSCTWSLMKDRGWKSESTLNKAKKDLLHYGWIITSRQGGLNRCSLFAITFKTIDYCNGKLDIKETHVPPHTWKLDPLLRDTK